MSRIRVAVADGTVADDSWINPVAAELDIELVRGPGVTTEDLAKITEDCSALMIALHQMTPAIIQALDPKVKIIGRSGVGLDSINLPAAAEAAIVVVNQPTYAIHEVSNHAVAMLLALHRSLFSANSIVRSAGWGSIQNLTRVHSLQDSTVGVIGCGRIGQSAISKLQPFVKKVIGYDPFGPANIPGVEMVNDLSELLRQSQLVTLHAPYMPSTHHIIGAEQIALMPKGSILVNVSRGGLIDEDALSDALVNGHLAAAGLDVFEKEPLSEQSPLRSAPNLILTPHVAWYSESSGPRLIEWTLRDIYSFVTEQKITYGNFAAGPY